MRTLLAIAIVMGGIVALNPAADADRYKRNAESSDHAAERYRLREQLVCEERARHEDPGRYYADFPCWAREAFGSGSRAGEGRQ